MANNYCQFSNILPLKTGKEKEWLQKELKKISDRRSKWLADMDSPEPMGDFGWELVDQELWLYGDETFNADHVAKFVRAFLKKFRPKECWGFSWATTCSKLRVGEFDGGAAFVTADKIEYISGSYWLEGKIKAHTSNICEKCGTKFTKDSIDGGRCVAFDKKGRPCLHIIT